MPPCRIQSVNRCYVNNSVPGHKDIFIMSKVPPHPDPFLQIRVERLDLDPSLAAFCAGYEQNEWRSKQLASHLLDWLPEFALKNSEWQGLQAHNARKLLSKAAQSIYTSPKYKSRGEFGEILLHIILRQYCKSVPAISKYYYKDSRNDTVKGFDAVHIVGNDDNWELWLGEVKFYNRISAAIKDVVEELRDHVDADFLRAEFTAITNKLDADWCDTSKLQLLLNKNTSLDDIFKVVRIPVLLTYDSSVVAGHSSVCDKFKAEFEKEVLAHRQAFANANLPANLTIHLFLLPLKDKATLVAQMDEALKQCQAI